MVASKFKEDTIESITKSMDKTSIGEVKAPVSPAKKVSNNTLASRQMAEITNTSKDRASHNPPPHLRAKGAAKTVDTVSTSEASVKPSAPTPAAKVAEEVDTKPTPAMLNVPLHTVDKKTVNNTEKIVPEPASTTDTTKKHENVKSVVDKSVSVGAEKSVPTGTTTTSAGTKQNPIIVGDEDGTNKSTTSGCDDLMAQLTALKNELAILRVKVTRLESENFTITKHRVASSLGPTAPKLRSSLTCPTVSRLS